MRDNLFFLAALAICCIGCSEPVSKRHASEIQQVRAVKAIVSKMLKSPLTAQYHLKTEWNESGKLVISGSVVSLNSYAMPVSTSIWAESQDGDIELLVFDGQVALSK